jgi:hypothetical protein
VTPGARRRAGVGLTGSTSVVVTLSERSESKGLAVPEVRFFVAPRRAPAYCERVTSLGPNLKGNAMEGGEAAGGIIGCLFAAVFGLIGLAMFAFCLWMLIDCIKNTPSENNTKLIYILLIVFTGAIGAAIYYFVQRPKNPPREAGPPA